MRFLTKLRPFIGIFELSLKRISIKFLTTSRFILKQLKGFVQKGRISHFWLIFIFLQDRANFWQTDLF